MDGVRIILGMDISTTCCGVSILKYNTHTGEKEIMYIGSVKFKTQKGLTTEDSLFVKSRQFTEDFINKYKDIFDAISVAPQYISSYDARKYAFPTLMSVRRYDKKDEPYSIDKVRKAIKKNELTPFGGYTYSTDKKYVLWELINKSYDGIVWQYNKNGELKKENFDASDSLVAILGWINYIKYHDDEPKVVDMSEKNISDNDGNTFTKITYSVRFCDETNTKTAVF